MSEQTFDAIERLARKVLEGDVVFFIGAGFSLDSEGNSGERQIKRLVIRLLAFIQALQPPDQKPVDQTLLSSFRQSFDLKGKIFRAWPAPPPFELLKSDLRRLTTRYFETNDWFCDAYAQLLTRAGKEWNTRVTELCENVARIEENLRLHTKVRDDLPELDEAGQFSPPKDQAPPLDTVRLSRLDKRLLVVAARGKNPKPRAAGKALFLDTMGFRDPQIMAGDPASPGLDEVAASYVGKLLPRHHVIARLAREGLCTTTITTNFDLLLEGAFRVAGFTAGPPAEDLPFTTFSQLATVASADTFFSEGKPHRTSVLVKMHGCAHRYRQTRRLGDGVWGPYLRSMVFTYREIQNWREDSWAADFLRTLLRTRTVVFCGYSLQDPVVHDTFRTVYEEMGRLRQETGPTAAALRTGAMHQELSAAAAPAFFFGSQPEFHGLAVLQAASKAMGAPAADFGRHPNHIQFFYGGEKKFPQLDELFRWLFHLFLRFRQQECLKTDLRRISTLLLGSPRREAELENIRLGFKQLLQSELNLAKGWGTSLESRLSLEQTCAWTEFFHLGLLREFSAAEVLHRRQGPGTELALLRRFPWHYPAMQDSGWTAWGAVVELALRRLLSAPRARLLQPARCQQPTVLYELIGGAHAPCGLTVHLAGFQRLDRSCRIQGHAVRRTFWELDPEDAPWPRGHKNGAAGSNLAGSTTATPAGKPGTLPADGTGAGAPKVRRHTGKHCFLAAPSANLLWEWAAASGEPLAHSKAWLWQANPMEALS